MTNSAKRQHADALILAIREGRALSMWRPTERVGFSINLRRLFLMIPPATLTPLEGRLSAAASAKQFVLAGHATFTIRSRVTGTRFTYKVVKCKSNPVWFVSLLRGPSNENDYCYMGVIRAGVSFHVTTKSTVKPEAPSAKAFVWFWRNLVGGVLPDSVELWHEGRCGRCGRKLTVPSSIESGIGPECAARMAA